MVFLIPIARIAYGTSPSRSYSMSRVVSILVMLLSILAGMPIAESRLDTSLFTLPLSEDSASLFYCAGGAEIRKTLSGPIVMEDNTLLFYSINGYVLCSYSGAILDSHSVARENRQLSPNDPQCLKLAYPLDRSTILYYRETPQGKRPLEIYQKNLFKERMKPLKEELYEGLKTIPSAHIFNQAFNSLTDEMAAKTYLAPQMVGFTSLADGAHWWSTDRFFSYSSSLINEEKGEYISFFSGIKESESSPAEIKRQMVEPLALFIKDGQTNYVGVYTTMGTTEERYYQRIYVCDQAGNCLLTDTLLKQTNIDAVLGEVEEEKMIYTVKQTGQLVFQPSVDSDGSLFYGILDYANHRIEVHVRRYARYRDLPGEPDCASLIDSEKDLAWEPVSIPCNPQQSGGKTIPAVTFTNNKGARRTATANDLTRDDYLVRIGRTVYRDIDAKLSRLRHPLPEAVRAIGDSLARFTSAGCPYTISLSGPRGVLQSFDYPPGIKVLCARVITHRESGEVIVRVDLENYAEIIIFGGNGDFIDRFIFNRQHYRDRADIVVAAAKGNIVELDNEPPQKKPRFRTWVRQFSDITASADR
jgi:hypothetical protein